MPIVQIDGHRIGTGRPGEMTTRLRDLYLEKYVYRTSD
jgi:branched-subunit amino acid aminotransferase/4-amino-4-deoxychorismate lyase